MKALQLLMIAAACLPVLSVGAYGADIQAGTWSAIMAKSTFSPGPAPKAQLTKIVEVDGGIKLMSDRTDAAGKVTHFEYTVKYDGKDYPVVGDPSRDAVSTKKIDAFTIETISKKAGKVMTTLRIDYAKDGKSRTETIVGSDLQGNKIHNVMYWEKQ